MGLGPESHRPAGLPNPFGAADPGSAEAGREARGWAGLLGGSGEPPLAPAGVHDSEQHVRTRANPEGGGDGGCAGPARRVGDLGLGVTALTAATPVVEVEDRAMGGCGCGHKGWRVRFCWKLPPVLSEDTSGDTGLAG